MHYHKYPNYFLKKVFFYLSTASLSLEAYSILWNKSLYEIKAYLESLHHCVGINADHCKLFQPVGYKSPTAEIVLSSSICCTQSNRPGKGLLCCNITSDNSSQSRLEHLGPIHTSNLNLGEEIRIFILYLFDLKKFTWDSESGK